MTKAQAKRYQRLDSKMCEMARQMWDLLAPTNEEINEAVEMVWQDSHKELAETATDTESPLGKWFMCGEIEILRELADEEEKDGKANG